MPIFKTAAVRKEFGAQIRSVGAARCLRNVFQAKWFAVVKAAGRSVAHGSDVVC
ncbi:MAG: hypothetical protein ACI4QH_04965 [Candidatus Fimimonas sp.]